MQESTMPVIETTPIPNYFGKYALTLISILGMYFLTTNWSSQISTYPLVTLFVLAIMVILSLIPIALFTRNFIFTISWIPVILFGHISLAFLEVQKYKQVSILSNPDSFDLSELSLLMSFWTITIAIASLLAYRERHILKKLWRNITNKTGVTNLIFVLILLVPTALVLFALTGLYPMLIAFGLPFLTPIKSLAALPAVIFSALLFLAIGINAYSFGIIMLISLVLALTLIPGYIAMKNKLG
ncbi:MAG: hypothetical protein V7765_07760 [Oleispira sp.]